MPRYPAFLCALCALLSCQSAPTPSSASTVAPRPSATPALDLRVARAPFDSVDANWKQRLDQPYVYLEGRGDYRGIGRLIERAFLAADEQDIEVAGPPFALYYDDPGRVAADALRMRACLPVDSAGEVREPLAQDLLASTTVVYAYVAGPYPEVPRAYPGLFAFMRELDWVECGPVREIYLSDPASVLDWDELLTEVQVPATRRP
jgi:effector-binding domain-containing protein